MFLRLNSGLQTASALVKQHVVLGLVFVTTLQRTLTLIVADTQRIFRVELGGNAENVGRTLWGNLATATRLLLGGSGPRHRIADLLKACLPKKGLDP